MKRTWLIILLLSLGMNLGLGLNALRNWFPASEPLPQPLQDSGLDMSVDQERVERFLGRRLERMAARLDLSPQQKTALWDLHLADGQNIVKKRRVLQQARAALQHLLSDAEPSLAEVQAAQHQISALQMSLDSVVVRVMFHERAILTSEQRQAYHGWFPHKHENQRGRQGYSARHRRDRD